MGYVKYREDDIKINDERAFSKYGFIRDHCKPPIQYFECMYCHSLYEEKSKLFLHIKSEHNIVRPILCINGRVVSDSVVLQYVKSCIIYTYGFDDKILLGNELLNNLERDNSIDITDKIRALLNCNSTCELSFSGIKVEIKLMQHKIESEELVAATLDKWQTDTEKGKTLDTSVFTILSGSDKLFLEGMYNYYLACNAKHDKAKRYDDAYAKLSLFHDIQGIGRCALKVISFRRNWINKLKILSDDVCDIFHMACLFYDNAIPENNFELVNSEKSLYLDDSVAVSLELITMFQSKHFDELEKRIPKLEKIEVLSDLNLSDQLKLVKAKFEAVKGNLKESKRCVDSINDTRLCEIGYKFYAFVAK